MTSTTPTPRRPLPPGVYWRRRLFVVGVLVALFLIVVNAVNGGSDPGGEVQATTASGEQVDPTQTPSAEPTTEPDTGTKGKKGHGGKKATTSETPAPTVVLPTAPVLAEPEGECADDDVAVTPTVRNAVAGESATIVLQLRTIEAEACTWQVSADTLAVKISVGDDEVWASRECPGQLPERAVVVRQAVSSTYELRWNTRRSDTGCPGLTDYAAAGDYRVTAASYGGEPADLVFALVSPTAPEPDPEPDAEKLSSKKGKTNDAG
ncbi:hypothetical protein BH09ACT12_BH09ACT12_18670 [soil metagenome]